MAVDYYTVLGVARDASAKDIKAAYRRLARKYHPDLNSGDAAAEAKFKEINEAHEVLGDPKRRSRYDRLGDRWRDPEPRPYSGSTGRYRSSTGHASRGGFADFFSNLFGGGQGGWSGGVTFEESPTSASYQVAVTLSLEQAYSGSARTVEAPPDPRTGARGRRIEVRIPPGVESGARIHAGGTGGLPDFLLNVTVAPHSRFERQGDNLAVTVDVPLTDAVLGAEVEVPTLRGRAVALKVPPETQNGRTFRLKGQGMPRKSGGAHGDLLATVKVALPSGLSNNERALFEQLRDARAGRTEAASGERAG